MSRDPHTLGCRNSFARSVLRSGYKASRHRCFESFWDHSHHMSVLCLHESYMFICVHLYYRLYAWIVYASYIFLHIIYDSYLLQVWFICDSEHPTHTHTYLRIILALSVIPCELTCFPKTCFTWILTKWALCHFVEHPFLKLCCWLLYSHCIPILFPIHTKSC